MVPDRPLPRIKSLAGRACDNDVRRENVAAIAGAPAVQDTLMTCGLPCSCPVAQLGSFAHARTVITLAYVPVPICAGSLTDADAEPPVPEMMNCETLATAEPLT